MRFWLYAFVSGLVLSALRAPLGLDVTQTVAVDPGTASILRAGGLLGVAVFLDPRRPLFRRPVPIVSFVLFATLGFLLHGLFVAPMWVPASRMAFTIVLVSGALLLFWISGRGATPDADGEDALEEVGLRERIGFGAAGLGCAIAFENLARHMRLLGTGLAEEETLYAGVFLLLVAVGARAFGRALTKPGRERAVAAAGVVAAAMATLVGLRFLDGFGREEFHRYVRTFGSDITEVGMPQTGALLAAACFVVPAFVLGAALAGARHPRRLSSLLDGAAMGMIFVPVLAGSRAKPLAYPDVLSEPWAWWMLAAGTLIATAGAVLALAGRGADRARWTAIVLALAAVAVVVLVRPRVWLFSPWFPADVQPILTLQLSGGLYTVEADRRGGIMATHDRRRVTPMPEEERADAGRLAQAWRLLPGSKRADGTARVLFIGQMTPSRASTLAGLGVMRLDRTAPWREATPHADRLFFGEAEPPGTSVTPAEARRRMRDGAYDLVVALPSYGPILPFKGINVLPWAPPPAVALTGLSVPDGTLAVVWTLGSTPPRGGPGARFVMAGDGLASWSLGTVLGDADTNDGDDAPLVFEGPGAIGAPDAVGRLFTRAEVRPDRHAARNARRIAAAQSRPELARLAEAFAVHFEAQAHSNPWETAAQQVELDEAALAGLRDATLELGARPFLRQVWDGLAPLLAEKRLPDLVLRHVKPVTDAFGPWPALDRAVATAYQEFDERLDVVDYLNRLVAANPNDIGTLVECADWVSRLGDQLGAIEYLNTALALQPGRYDIERRLGMAQVRAGLPGGRELLERLSAAHPQDEEIQLYLGDGPLPPLPQGYRPESTFHDHDHDDG